MNQILAGIPFTRPQTNIAGWKNQCCLTPGTDFRILSPGDMFQLYRRAQSMVSRDVFFFNKRWIQRCPEIPNILGIFGVFFLSVIKSSRDLKIDLGVSLFGSFCFGFHECSKPKRVGSTCQKLVKIHENLPIETN